MIEAVAKVMRSVAAETILPRFRSLQPEDIGEKPAGEIVTAADREAEALLSRALIDLLPDSSVVGEEATAAEPHLRDQLRDARRVWLVDSLDGTMNFVKGDGHFAMLIALVERGETVASWILDPLTDVLAVAERGSGAFLAGARMATPQRTPDASDVKGAILTRFLPFDVRANLERRRAAIGTVLPGLLCAGHEYVAVATGTEHFALFWRTEPWDHAPGALFLTEAGGFVARPDGTAYTVRDGRSGLLVAESKGTWEVVRRILFGPETDT